MSRLINSDPTQYAIEALEGFALANSRYVKPVFGGVVRSTKTPEGKVALVVGGGSGHYPAFAGWVGPGFADGAVAGNIFASPSGSQAYSVCMAANRGGGVLIGYGNYAGDVLHFGQAIEQLKAQGIDARSLEVTDDIASAPKDQWQKRRGIAGDLLVFKIVAAACEAGKNIDEVVEVFHKANERTRTFGVAFSGCTLPGSQEPLFTVPKGKMGIGLGIHGEPGIDEQDLGTADDLGKMLVDGLLGDRPDNSGKRVVALVNGLGSATYEDLFMVYRSVHKNLTDAGIEIVEGEADEFVTSLDMNGLSLTLVWLDDELEQLWTAPCDTPAYRRGGVGDTERDDTVLNNEAIVATVETPGSADSQALAGALASGLGAVAGLIADNEKMLGDLDAVAGDGDHGIGMHRGSRAAAKEAERLASEGAGAQTLLVGAGQAWSENAGGTSGAIWGAMLTALGNAFGDQDAAKDATVGEGLQGSLDAVVRMGGAKVGDKTLVDALEPLVNEFTAALASGASLADAADRAASKAQAGADSTKDFVAKLGRSRPLGEKSVGTPNPGAVSLAMSARTVAELLK